MFVNISEEHQQMIERLVRPSSPMRPLRP